MSEKLSMRERLILAACTSLEPDHIVDAILAELREPDKAMIEAGGYPAREYEPGGFILGEEVAAKCFAAMIDAISRPTGGSDE